MRLLLYALQSSGASAVSFTLAQKPDCIAFVDIWNNFAAPELATDLDVVAKVVATTAYPLEVHRRRFKPDVTALVLRHPVLNFESLRAKPYVHEGGLINEKFRILESELCKKGQFDLVVHYEDLVYAPGMLIDAFRRVGWTLGIDALRHQRTAQDMRATNEAMLPYVTGRLKYGLGSFSGGGLRRAPIVFPEAAGDAAHLPGMCPALWQHYETLRAARRAAWRVPAPGLLACDLIDLVKSVTGQGRIPDHAALGGFSVELYDGYDGCTVSDDAITLSPGADGGGTRLRIGPLPGEVFNRVCGHVVSAHWCGVGTRIEIRVERGSGGLLATQTLVVDHGSLVTFELCFAPPGAGSIDLIVIVARVSERAVSEHDAVSFRSILLDRGSDG